MTSASGLALQKALQGQFAFKVHIFDTDCYGVMWHGAYAKWLEMSRCELLEQLDVAMSAPDEAVEESWIYPVVEQTLRYKRPAKLNEALVITTLVSVQGPRLVFSQAVALQSEPNQVKVESQTVCVVCDGQFKPYRRVPAALLAKLGLV